ncbi:hypothetical protein ACFQ0R_02670 [Psychroflexus salinarum]|uniref:Lipoprotein n=1 Tax=Psychroflexus salinarum TaxID=546024 RepID=A0ABW3GLK5_9FLAO
MVKYYKYTLLFFTISIFGCYNDDDNQVVEAFNATHKSSELTSVIKSITSHDGSFDDHIDNTSCFSLVFPYQLKINSKLQTFNSSRELLTINDTDEIEIVFPISIALKNYQIFEVNSSSELMTHKSICEESLHIESNSCLDLVYSITIKEFNELNGTFETFHFTNNKDIYLYLEELHDSDVYEIQYPISLTDNNSETTIINSSHEFIEAYEFVDSYCD